MSRKAAPTKAAIAEAWGGTSDECAACGYVSDSLQRCHLTPHALGGSDTDPANFVLLCGRCHAEAPDHVDGEMMRRWVVRHESDFAARARATAAAFDRVFPDPGVCPEVTTDHMRALVAEEMECVIPGRLSIGTVEAVAERVALRLLQEGVA